MDVLNKSQRTKEDGHLPAPEQEGDDYDFWQNLDLERLKRYELRNYLAARDLSTGGKKKELIRRLRASIEADRLEEQAYLDELEAEFRRNADLEELGSVYAIGVNSAGQLGLGDIEPREMWRPILSLRGLSVSSVIAGNDTTFCLTQDHDVYAWGSCGSGPLAMQLSLEEVAEGFWLEPTFVQPLKGEDIIAIDVGASHGVAISDAGDCFTWGFAGTGQLGLGTFEPHPTPQIVQKLQATKSILQVASGEAHTLALTSEHQVYSWGAGHDGRLGLAATERIGVAKPLNRYFPSPCLVAGLARETVRQVAAGPNHSLALCNSGVFSWGCGAGGRLGHGDMLDRHAPARIVALDGNIVLSVVAATWHNAAVVLVPPLTNGGWVFTWGSGFHGQLGQAAKQTVLTPRPIDILRQMSVFAARVSCGSHHCALVTPDDELYTWGSNRHNCLGRKIQLWEVRGLERNPHLEEDEDEYYSSDESEDEARRGLDVPAFTPCPGHVAGFGTIVERTGRGLVQDVACGREFTVVVTKPYEGPTEETAKEIIEEEDIRLEERAARERQMARRRRFEMEKEQKAKARQVQVATEQAVMQFKCDIDDDCPGFERHVFKPNICKECGYAKSLHNTPIPPKKVGGVDAGDGMFE